MNKNIFLAKTEDDLKDCFVVIKQLRPHLLYEDFIKIYRQAHSSDGYEIVMIRENSEILAVMGYRVLSDFVRGRHIYIDDLVTSEKVRSKGFGAQLLMYAEVIAKELDCHVLRLCTGLDNERGIQFYEKNNWIKSAYAYTKKI